MGEKEFEMQPLQVKAEAGNDPLSLLKIISVASHLFMFSIFEIDCIVQEFRA